MEKGQRVDASGLTASRVAFVFQGGGSVAATQVGMLRALVEAGITPDLVIGASSGALNAVAFAEQPSLAGVDRLEQLWVGLRRKHVAPLSVASVIGAFIGRRESLVPNTAMRRFLESAAMSQRLEDTTLPVHVVATDMSDGATVVLSRGDIVTSLMASAAYPGLYPPVRLGGRYLIDGGVGADIPILQAEDLGAVRSYVLPAAISDQPETLPRGPVPLAFRAMSQVLDGVSRRDLALATGEVHLLPAPLTRAGHPLDFQETRRLIEDGYRLSVEWLAQRRIESYIPAPVDGASAATAHRS
jgi:NTE family protein